MADELTFSAINEPEPGGKLREQFERFWPGYERWFLREGDKARPTYARCIRALREHMPEIVPVYENLCDLVGGGDRAARFLALYRPTPYMAGCSQAIWVPGGGDEVALVRNYDYAPNLCEGLNLLSAWTGSPGGRVMVMADCLWGALDGMNEDGLAVALAFGGRKKVGDGFGIPLILRYVLETCRTTAQACEALSRVPSHMSYNISVVDRRGRHATVLLAPDRPAEITDRLVCTNHQGAIEWPEHAQLTETVEREQFLADRVADPAESLEALVVRFLHPPLYRAGGAVGFRHSAVGQQHKPTSDGRWRTLYTASYLPAHGQVHYLWPHDHWMQTFDHFTEHAPRRAIGESREGTE